MKTGKQFLALTLGLLLVLGLFAGCQQEKAPATEPSTEPVTEAPTEAPTEEPTEAPTEATEPATEPEDAVTNVFLQEPEGFFVDTTTGFLRAPGFPDDMSYISVIPTPQNTAVLDMSAEQYEAAMKLSLAAMGQDAEATVESVEKTEVDGYPTVKSVSQLTMSGATFYITDYQIVASQNYSITFADATADGAWADAFDQAAASIDLLKEGETFSWQWRLPRTTRAFARSGWSLSDGPFLTKSLFITSGEVLILSRMGCGSWLESTKAGCGSLHSGPRGRTSTPKRSCTASRSPWFWWAASLRRQMSLLCW